LAVVFSPFGRFALRMLSLFGLLQLEWHDFTVDLS